jgi:hypothetical protein
MGHNAGERDGETPQDENSSANSVRAAWVVSVVYIIAESGGGAIAKLKRSSAQRRLLTLWMIPKRGIFEGLLR